MLYTVSEMAKKLGVAPSTLRYYDKEGLLPFVERSSGGVRMFKESDLSWLSIIQCLKKTGMPIREIRKFVDWCLVDWCLQGDDTIAQRLGSCDALRALDPAYIPPEIQKIRERLRTGDSRPW